jgi:hypothetical protein
MNRSLSKVPRLLRWRYLRWVACSAMIPALWACNSRRLAIPDPQPSFVEPRDFKQSVNKKLDILFMIDDSQSMAPLQKKLQMQLPAFMDALEDPTTMQLPDLHVAVVSSSFGGGAWSNVNQCHSASVEPNTLGDDQGRFLQGPKGASATPCKMLHSDTKFLINGDGTAAHPANFDGDIRDAFSCMAYLGDQGCGFESQFESVYYGLYKGSLALGPTEPPGQVVTHDPDNGGFLRGDAVLAIVMVTNEDDCSVSGDSLLLDPLINTVNDASGLGALASYRCNEFGHLCDGMPPPHNPPASTVTLNHCVSAEDMGKTEMIPIPNGNGKTDSTQGHLFPTVKDFTSYILQYKANPDDILVAAIAGPVDDGKGNSLYRVHGEMNPSANNEVDPFVDHSCVQQVANGADPEYADPAVRIKQWVDSFGATNGVFYPICANNFRDAMNGIAMAINKKLGSSCVSTHITMSPTDPTKHNCTVTQRVTDSSNNVKKEILTECTAGNPVVPCFQLTENSDKCTDPAAKTLFKVCNDTACTMMMPGSTDSKDASISCVVD